MPRKNRPPIHLLEVFEAAARLESFKQAGEELHITASAISHQIKSLEEILGFPLFTRITRGVKLTKQGRDYAYSLSNAFRLIDQASDQILRNTHKTKVKVSIMPSLASNLVYPKLAEFKQSHPDIDLEIDSCEGLADLSNDSMDFAIRYGYGKWDSYQSKLLRRCHGVILASPEFLAANPIDKPEQLRDIPLICLSHMESAWYAWAKHFKLDNFQVSQPLNYHSYGTAIQAALQDVGPVGAVYELEKSLVDKQKLVPIFDTKTLLDSGIYLVKNRNKKLSDASQTFIDWLIKQIESL